MDINISYVMFKIINTYLSSVMWPTILVTGTILPSNRVAQIITAHLECACHYKSISAQASKGWGDFDFW